MRKASVNFKHYHVTLSEDIRAVATLAIRWLAPGWRCQHGRICLPWWSPCPGWTILFEEAAVRQYRVSEERQSGAEGLGQEEESRSNSLWKRRVEVEHKDFLQQIPRHPKTLLQSRLVLMAVAWTHWRLRWWWLGCDQWQSSWPRRMPKLDRCFSLSSNMEALIHCLRRISQNWFWRHGERQWLLGVRGHLHRKATLSAVQRGWSSARSTRWAGDRFTEGSPNNRDHEAFQLRAGKREASRKSQKKSAHLQVYPGLLAGCERWPREAIVWGLMEGLRFLSLAIPV